MTKKKYLNKDPSTAHNKILRQIFLKFDDLSDFDEIIKGTPLVLSSPVSSKWILRQHLAKYCGFNETSDYNGISPILRIFLNVDDFWLILTKQITQNGSFDST